VTSQSVTGNPLRVLFLAAEAEPFVKVGGLGDVGGSLPVALRGLNLVESLGRPLDVRLVIPFHGVIDPAAYTLQPITPYEIKTIDTSLTVRAFSTQIQGVPAYLISGTPILRDAPVYSQDALQDGRKYTFFSIAALELARQLDWAPDIIHANDWHTAMAVYSLALRRENDAFFADTHSLLTVHNLPFMGAGTESALAEYMLPPSSDERLPVWARGMPLPLGLLSADQIVAVSPTYSSEILTPEFGCGLEGFLQTRFDHIAGILNGLDTAVWNPSTDRGAQTAFDAANLDLRWANKTAIQKRLSFVESQTTPLLAFIGRMDPQKGLDILLRALDSIRDLDWQMVILGTGIPALENEARQMENNFPDRLRAVVRFDGPLSHLLYAGADLLMMPSRYEPCGLAQMIAMRYGCVPMARATGGLADTIHDAFHAPDGNGFLFEDATPDALAFLLRKTLYRYSDRRFWQAIQERGMRVDFSWKNSAKAYAALYSQLTGDQA
jgi:starch synthase